MTWTPTAVPDQSGRTIVVTGSTAGIGYFAAEQLASAGAHVVLASRSAVKLDLARRAILEQVPSAEVSAVTIDLASLASVDRAADELTALARLDGIFLNGGSMILRRGGRTADGHPMLIGTHVIANVRLLERLRPALVASADANGREGRVVHASTGYVSGMRFSLDDVLAVPMTGIGAYTKAKTVTEVYAYELDRRFRAEGTPLASIVTHPGIGVDAKTPMRAGIHDHSTPRKRNPYTPWAQGKDAAAWSAVRALTDPTVAGGQYLGPKGGVRGLPELLEPLARTAHPEAGIAVGVWDQLREIAAVDVSR